MGVNAITTELQAKHHIYNVRGQQQVHVIHCVGLDFNHPRYQVANIEMMAHSDLTALYINVFREFAASGCSKLRLLPVSATIFAGRLKADMPGLTAKALVTAYSYTDDSTKQYLKHTNLELCIYSDDEFKSYDEAAKCLCALTGCGKPSWNYQPGDFCSAAHKEQFRKSKFV